MTKNREISESDLIGSESTQLTPPKQKETTTVKTSFLKSIKFAVLVTVILTALSIYAGYRLYDFVYTQGYQDAVNEREAIAKQVAELSKAKQQ